MTPNTSPPSSASSRPIAVVTGTSRGLGAEFVRQLLDQGYEVHAVSRKGGKSSTAFLKTHEIDLESKEGPRSLAGALEGRPITLLINNAGVFLDDSEVPFAKLDFEVLRKSFEVNTLIAGRVCQALLPNLEKASSTQSRPKVVQITSLMGSIADNTGGGYYGYRVSKAALNMLNKSFAIDHPFLTAIVLHPGWVKTEMGGSEAPTLPADSVRGMLKVIDRATEQDSGKFFDFEGDTVPW